MLFAYKDDVLSTHLVHYDLALGRLGHVNHLLHHVVGVLVLHHGVQGAVGPVLLAAHLVDQQSPLGTRRVDHTFLHNVAEEKDESFNNQFITSKSFLFPFVPVSESTSKVGVTNLPCKFVLTEDQDLSTNLSDYLAFVFWSAVLQNMLNDVVTILILQGAEEV